MSDEKSNTIATGQILSVANLEGFDDDFTDFKISEDGKSLSSDHSEATASYSTDITVSSDSTVNSDSDCTGRLSSLSSQHSSASGDYSPENSSKVARLPPPPSKSTPRNRDLRSAGPDTPVRTFTTVPPPSQDSLNHTTVKDEDDKYFTVIHDAPSRYGGPCKKCPQMQLPSLKEWWIVQKNLNPRARHSLKVTIVVLGSALLLLAIFLLARIPSAAPDVLSPKMYDLPEDDMFRPHHHSLADPNHLQELDSDQSNRGAVPKVSDMIHRNRNAQREKLSHKTEILAAKLEAARKVKMEEFSDILDFDEKAKKVAVELVKDTVKEERDMMQDLEYDIWKEGATPLKVLLVSTWRSGSTFLGQVLQQHPGVFQHYEPFSYFGVKQIRSGSDAFQSQQLLHRLMECRFKGQNQYLNFSKSNPTDMIGHNKRIWNPCKIKQKVDICSDPSFLTETCNLFPIQLVKTVRLRLNLTQLFLGENRLNAKVIFLVRDPRATMGSRLSSVQWCHEGSDCYDPSVLCSDLKEDLKTAAAFQRLYPNSFIQVKYEDLANEPQTVVKNLLNFLGMDFTPQLSQFVKSHTESDLDTPWSIARKSAARVNRWKDTLKTEEIQEIENVCRPIIEKLGYEFH